MIFNDVDSVTSPTRQDVTFQFTYNDDGSRDTVIYPSGMIKDFDDFAQETGYTEETGVTRAYNANGQLSTISKPEGTINYSYDQFGSLSSSSYFGHTVNYDYDFFGRLQTFATPKAQWNYTYNCVGLKAEEENLTVGSTVAYEYDSLGRVEKKTVYNPDDTINFEADYVLGVSGNRTRIVETRGIDMVQWDYEYDELGRLTREQRSGVYARDVSYTYDKDSNRKTETDNLRSSVKEHFYYDGTQRLEKIEKDSVLYESYTWHEGGQLATKTDSDGIVWTYTWDGQTLVSVESSEDLRVEYTYDEYATLVRRKLYNDGELISDTRYLVDRNNLTGYSQVIAEIDGITGQLQNLNFFSDEIKTQSIANTKGNYSLHTDALGSIRSLTGTSISGDAISDTYDYTAFGSRLPGSGSLTDYSFTGQTRDSSTALQYHRARWLDTSRGRWASTDPVFDFPYNDGNEYSYVGSSPANNIDLTGQYTITEVISTVGTISTLSRLGLYGVEAIDTALGIDLISDNRAASIRRVLDIADWITLPFDIGAILLSLPKLGRVLAKGAQFIATAFNVSKSLLKKASGSLFALLAVMARITRNFVSWIKSLQISSNLVRSRNAITTLWRNLGKGEWFGQLWQFMKLADIKHMIALKYIGLAVFEALRARHMVHTAIKTGDVTDLVGYANITRGPQKRALQILINQIQQGNPNVWGNSVQIGYAIEGICEAAFRRLGELRRIVSFQKPLANGGKADLFFEFSADIKIALDFTSIRQVKALEKYGGDGVFAFDIWYLPIDWFR
ncbi:RHS repeat domain-containing protein [Candidatus Sumerlaeota bacterium]